MKHARMLFTARAALACALALAFCGAARAQTSNALLTGQLACSTSAQQLPSPALSTGVYLRAATANTGKVFVGAAAVTTATGYPLDAGAGLSLDTTSLSMIWFVCQNTTDKFYYVGH